MDSPYDILKADFCIYCQHQYASPKNLQTHILAKHRGTYAYNSLIAALNKKRGK